MKESTKQRVKEEGWDMAKQIIVSVVVGVILIIVGGRGGKA